MMSRIVKSRKQINYRLTSLLHCHKEEDSVQKDKSGPINKSIVGKILVYIIKDLLTIYTRSQHNKKVHEKALSRLYGLPR